MVLFRILTLSSDWRYLDQKYLFYLKMHRPINCKVTVAQKSVQRTVNRSQSHTFPIRSHYQRTDDDFQLVVGQHLLERFLANLHCGIVYSAVNLIIYARITCELWHFFSPIDPSSQVRSIHIFLSIFSKIDPKTLKI